MKKLLLLFFVLLPIICKAANPNIGGIIYKIDEEAKTAVVSKANEDYLGEVIIPEKIIYDNSVYTVTSIAEHAFYNKYFTTIVIPKTVKSIGDYAFASERDIIISVYLLSEELVSSSLTAFNNCNLQKSTLYVPENLIATYKATDPFDKFETIEKYKKNEVAYKVIENAYTKIMSQLTAGYSVYPKNYNPTDMGYPVFMVATAEMLGDMYPVDEGVSYDWFTSYGRSIGMGENDALAYIQWYTLVNIINACNIALGSAEIIDDAGEEADLDEVKGMQAAIYAIRAFCYYTMMVFYEPFANPYTDCSSVIGLTVPIVTEMTTDEKIHNNPRATHQDMIDFLLSDLDYAESIMEKWDPAINSYLGLSVVYGLKAKVYLWDENYASAAQFARKAIDLETSKMAKPMSEEEWEDPHLGFVKATSGWMWYTHYNVDASKDLCNFVGWMSGECDWGYAAVTRPCIDRSLYDKINNTDFRKHVFIDPGKYDYYEYKTARDRSYIESAPAYLSLKFRCRAGEWRDGTYGGSTDVPLMRIEEMYLIEAEAAGVSVGLEDGIQKLNDFIKTYRDPNYSFSTAILRDFQLEVLNQMRIEFWGEGIAFPSAKRLRVGVMQNYTGTNAPNNDFMINCKIIKPNWNFVIPKQAIDDNVALVGMNNPEITDAVQTPSPENEYSEGKYSSGIIETKNGTSVIRDFYTVDGKRVDNLTKGLNIIRMDNGKTKKVVVK